MSNEVKELPDPQLIVDANSVTVFCSIISQATVKLVNGGQGIDPDSPEYKVLKPYLKENLPKLQDVAQKLLADLG